MITTISAIELFMMYAIPTFTFWYKVNLKAGLTYMMIFTIILVFCFVTGIYDGVTI